MNDLQAAEKSLNTISESMLAGVGVKYGKDYQYEQAGSVRKSECKKPAKKAAAAKAS